MRHGPFSLRPSHALRLSSAVALFAMGASLPASVIAQQDPDIRDIKPVMMLVIDTSGSMERIGDCVCLEDDPACTQCVPDCSVSQRNRWAVTLEALTGSFDDFSCTAIERRTPNAHGIPFSYDRNYYLPYHRPEFTAQNADGILDAYIDRVKFGLMTFDGMPTWFGASPLVLSAQFNNGRSEGDEGLWSYGGARDFFYPGCSAPFRMDSGVRGPQAADGALISVGNEDSAGFDLSAVNASIQTSLMSVRPYGGTPIAAALEDLTHYFGNHPDVSPTGDPFHGCRRRYALLLTDGYPDDDFRRFGCDQPGYTCPYLLPEDAAFELRCGPNNASCGTETGPIEQLFVVGFDVQDDPATVQRLHDIAMMGGSDQARFAANRTELLAALSEVLDSVATNATSRTAPAFATGTTGAQYEFGAGFQVGAGSTPWRGILERRRFECTGTGEDFAAPQPITHADRFHLTLNDRSAPRDLWTVIPPSGLVTGSITRGGGGAACGSQGCPRTAFAPGEPAVTPEHLGLAAGNLARRNAIMAWVHGTSGVRAEHRLGDIYHSSPVVMGPPSLGSADETFREYRRQPEIGGRPNVLFVGTNDGIFHAFATENWSPPAGSHVTSRTLTEGEELWGFVPPILLPRLDAATLSHQFMVDATPTVQDTFFQRTEAASFEASDFHTVLVSGLRGGGRAFFALDVTNPLDPQFMWQFTHANLGPTYGRPAIGRMYVDFDGQAAMRAVAILPGGKGTLANTGSCPGFRAAGAAGVTLDAVDNGGPLSHRANVRCWNPEGRSLFVVELETGRIIHQFDHSVFPSPLVGSVSVFSNVGDAPITRAFVTDADGVLWRIDFTSSHAADWRAVAFHDLFFDATGSPHAVGQPSYEPPVLSMDGTGRLIVVQATGDTDALVSSATNRVVSLTELLSPNNATTFDASGVRAALNWTQTLAPGETVTGPMQLINGIVFFASFTSNSSSNACDFGWSSLHAYDYVQNNGASPPGPIPPHGISLPSAFNNTNQNQIFSGVGVHQRVSCYVPPAIPGPDVPAGQQGLAPLPQGSTLELVVPSPGGGGSTTSGGDISTLRVPLDQPLDRFPRIQAWIPSTD